MLLNNLKENKVSFIYNIISDCFLYFSPSVEDIIGYDLNKYLNKGLVVLKKVIHGEDFPDFIFGLLKHIKAEKKRNGSNIIEIPESLVCRVKHTNGQWINIRVNNINLAKSENDEFDLLAGCIGLDGSTRTIDRDNGNNVSHREKEVLQLVSNGDSTKIIAGKLHISETTVITHRKHLLEKFQAINTAHLIKEAFKANLII